MKIKPAQIRTYKFEDFAGDIEKNIREGIYKQGQKLPSVRVLKKQYQTSISTIQNGYEHLMIKGLVVSIPKSGYYVASKPPQLNGTILVDTPVVRDALFEKNVELTTSSREKKIAEFNVATPGDLLISQKLLLRAMQQVIREKGVSLLRYYPVNGLEELKANIVKYAAGYQTRINPKELLVADGTLQGIHIALAVCCQPGDIVAVESPCVFSILEVIRVLGLKVIEIPVVQPYGFDVSLFKKVCETNLIKAVIVTPNFHNPTGFLLPDDHKKELVAIAVQYNIALIENDIYGDLHFSGKRPLTLKSFDESGQVMTVSSYAKTLAPGLRLGWLSAGKYFGRAEQIRFTMGSTVSPVYQETVNRLLSTDSYARHIRAFRLKLAKNAYLTIQLLAQYFPEDTIVCSPTGGYNLWVKMPKQINMREFYRNCEKIGVKFTPGTTFSFSDDFEHYFRLVFADQYSAAKIGALKTAGQLYR